jgi:hypothetical protein
MSQTSWLTATLRPGATSGQTAGTQRRPPRHPMVREIAARRSRSAVRRSGRPRIGSAAKLGARDGLRAWVPTYWGQGTSK